MELLEKISDGFTSFTEWSTRAITGMFGSSNERRIRKIGYFRNKNGTASIVPGSLLEQINSFEPQWEAKSNEELLQATSQFRDRIKNGETLEDILPEAFAAVRESAKRNLKMRHYDVQMVGGYILHQGMISEMTTGEGKTLVSTLSAFLNALVGNVHVITVNDYLALRDMEWMGPVHMALGLTVGAIQGNMSPSERQAAYACDITYGTNNEFGFDYLRDNMKPTAQLQVQGSLDYAIVDEIDNILIDEARTPLIISGPAHDDITKYAKANKIAKQLIRGEHFEVKEKDHTCHLTEDGVRRGEELAEVDSFYTVGNMEWPHLIDNALRAYHLYKRDVNYVVEGKEIIIVDEFTGRKMEGRQWSDGLHQAVEAKEGVTIKAENQTLATITLQNYFKLYKKLSGMTGTAMTEADEFWKIYKLDVIAVPTNRPMQRANYPDMIYRSENEKWDAVVKEVRDVHEKGRPILVGTVSIEKSELISRKLSKFGIEHNVLNAKHQEKEAELIAQAGRKNAVTIATNMAGRGTDIILGGNPDYMAWEELKQTYDSRLDVSKNEWDELTGKIAEREGMVEDGKEVSEIGGLHVIGTERHDSRRIDLQLRGRAGRQGDPGSSRFFLSLEDDLMRLFAGEWVKNLLTRLGMQEGEAIESRMVTKRVEAAQKKVEERHFDSRKNLLEYDELMDDQRQQVYSYRQKILDGTDCRVLILEMAQDQLDRWIPYFMEADYSWNTVAEWAIQNLQTEIAASSVKGMTFDQLTQFLKEESLYQAEKNIEEQIEVTLADDGEGEENWNWMALSRWANSQFGLNTNDSELKKIGREEILNNLRDRAEEALVRIDFTAIEAFLADDWGEQSLVAWLQQQFTLETNASEFKGMDNPEEIKELILQKISTLHKEKEASFPVAVGMTNFLSSDSSSGERYNREGLAKWANIRFEAELTEEEFRGKQHDSIEKTLLECNQRFLLKSESVEQKINEKLDALFGDHHLHLQNGSPVAEPEEKAIEELVAWANEEFHSELNPEDFQKLSREAVFQKLQHTVGERFRPELAHAERALLLEVLDTSWKDHLYFIDYLRSAIGLMGYAQKDPKTEFKREGRKAFLEMWHRMGQQVSSTIFRLERESPDFVGGLWEISSIVHEEVNTGSDFTAGSDSYEELSNQREPDSDYDAIDPIVNSAPKVGRNDPCTCGSGKKYKKCCGKN
ncbi:Protein translocase subunit SecA [hydrothermal vent metagenome]|uniref:Protein translocase subunit SecA n=1 Tax=hydrothermal vent metagenome TaxID=652676 RepID=A0A3B1DZR0_9ZZZZ